MTLLSHDIPGVKIMELVTEHEISFRCIKHGPIKPLIVLYEGRKIAVCEECFVEGVIKDDLLGEADVVEGAT